jgi:hypothetical protein
MKRSRMKFTTPISALLANRVEIQLVSVEQMNRSRLQHTTDQCQLERTIITEGACTYTENVSNAVLSESMIHSSNSRKRLAFSLLSSEATNNLGSSSMHTTISDSARVPLVTCRKCHTKRAIGGFQEIEHRLHDGIQVGWRIHASKVVHHHVGNAVVRCTNIRC